MTHSLLLLPNQTAIGPLMCALALTVWILTVFKELNKIAAMARAASALPRRASPRVVVVVEGDDDGDGEGAAMMVVESISPLRLGLFLVVCAARLALIGFLAYFGSLFLVHTIPLGDLLLNAVALEFVISIDELLFEVLAPAKLQRLVAAARPLKVRASAARSGLDAGSMGTLACVGGCIVAVCATVMTQQVDTLVSARDALCGGDQDFVYTTDGLGVPAWSYPEDNATRFGIIPARSFPGGTAPPTNALPYANLSYVPANSTFAERMLDVLLQGYGRISSKQTDCTVDMCKTTDAGGVQKLRADHPACCLAQKGYVPSLRAGTFSIVTKSRENTVEANQLWNPSCADQLLKDNGLQYVDLLEGAVGDAVSQEPCGGSCPPNRPFCDATRPFRDQRSCIRPTCADVARFCHAGTLVGVRARQLCPATCGCNDPRAPLALALPMSGCGDQCRRTGEYRAALAKLPCTDLPQNDTTLQAYVKDVIAVVQTWPGDWSTGATLMAKDVQKFGCRAFSDTSLRPGVDVSYPQNIMGVNLCTEAGNFFPVKAYSYFCPVACGCRAGDRHCPGTCPKRNLTSSAPWCPAWMKNATRRPFNPGTCPMSQNH